MPNPIQIGDRVEVFLGPKFWKSEGWFAGSVVRIDPYSEHRSFYWVELDVDVQSIPGSGSRLISIINPKNIRKA